MTAMITTLINNSWTLLLPEHRAIRPEWGIWYDDSGAEHFGWEVERLKSMNRNIGPGDVVFDVGTEEGDISALIQSWIGTGDGGVCLFEPNDRVWSNVRTIFDANHLKPPLTYWHGFAGNENGHLDTAEDYHDWPEASTGPVISDHGFCNLNERPDIPAIRLDDFAVMTGAYPNVITIDVEGAELYVLDGALALLGAFRPLVYCSVHPEFASDMYHYNVQVLYDYMGDLGYRSKVLEVDHEHHVVFWHPEGRELRL